MQDETTLKNLAKAKLLGSAKVEVQALFGLAYKLGVVKAEIEFSGSGDSGDIDEVNIYRKNGTAFEEIAPKKLNPETDEFEVDPTYTDDHKTLEELVEKFFHENNPDYVQWDWYNDEGGSGRLTLWFDNGHVHVTGSYNEVVSHDAGAYTFNVLGLEEEEKE
jgi:hypothetical protein